MVTNPDALLEPFVEAGASRISVHVEAATHLHRTLTRIRGLGAQSGVALNPATPASALDEIWPFADMVLVMSVNPGFGGQQFIAGTLDKLARIRSARETHAPAVELAVDGGVEPDNAEMLRSLGVNVLVAGTAVFQAADRRHAIDLLRGEER
jgi:ribulose-phosphate 3-epimerase